MKPQRLLFALFIFIGCYGLATAQKDETLFWLDDQPHSSDEFLYAYNKNRQATASQFTEKDLEDYFKLYVNFRLKVKEAKVLGYDQKPAFVQEMAGYKKQLAKPYLTQNAITEEIVKEAYGRTLEEVEASHILIELPDTASPEDTLRVYSQLTEIQDRVANGESFATLAKQYSQDPSARQNSGYLGYFGAFQMVYPFENAAFNTPVGQVSAPFRTSFGYHIVYVHSKRKALGSVRLAHIFFRTSADTTLAYNKALEVKAKLDNGESWASLAAQYSDEASNKNKGGELPWLAFRQLPPAFYQAGSQLTRPGDISGPVRAQNGWHIIKLLERKPVPPLSEVREMIESRISGDDRASSRTGQTVDSLVSRLKAVVIEDVKQAALAQIDGRILEGKWSYEASNKSLDDVVVSCQNSQFKVEDFFRFAEIKQTKKPEQSVEKYAEELWNSFLLEQLEAIELNNLYLTNKNYRFLYNEYFDGTLLFEVMNEKVWQRANTDSIGLQKFFNDYKSNYWWDQRAEVIIVEGRAEQLEKMAISSVDSLLLLEKYTVAGQADLLKCAEHLTRLADTLGTAGTYVFADKNTLNKLADSFGRQDSLPIFIESSSPSDQIELLTRSKSVLEQYFNAKDALSLKVSNSVLEKDNDLIPKEYWKPGLHFVNDGVFSKVFCIGEMLEPSQKNLDEVRGKVVSDYQQYLEDEWLGALREKHKVKTSSRAWKNVVKQLDE